MGYIGLERTVATSGADTVQTVSAGGGAGAANDSTPRKVKYITVHYSATPTQTGVKVTLNSGAGSTYDTVLYQGTANIKDHYLEFDNLTLLPDDQIDVLCPAAGGVITSRCAIVCEGAN